MNKPRYEHDCDECKFLGTFMQYDLYFCPQTHAGGVHAVLARDGNESGAYYTVYTRPTLYTHSKRISEHSVVMFAAGQRAIALGYTTEKQLTKGYKDPERYDD